MRLLFLFFIWEGQLAPIGDRVVVFFSDTRVPHEVLPCNAERFAITHWFYDQNERDICLNEQGKADDLLIEQRRIEQEIAKFEREHGSTAEKEDVEEDVDGIGKEDVDGIGKQGATAAPSLAPASPALATPPPAAAVTEPPASVTPPPSADVRLGEAAVPAPEFTQTTSFSPSKAERDAAAAEAETNQAQSPDLEVTLEALPDYGDHGGTRVQLIIPGLKTARDLEIESSPDSQTLLVTCEDPPVHLEQTMPWKFDIDGCTAKFKKKYSMLQVTCPHIAGR